MTSEHGNILPAHISVPLRALGEAKIRFRALALEFLPLFTEQEKQDELRKFFEEAVSELDCAVGVGLAEIVKDWMPVDRAELVTEMYNLNRQFEGIYTPGPDFQDTVH